MQFQDEYAEFSADDRASLSSFPSSSSSSSKHPSPPVVYKDWDDSSIVEDEEFLSSSSDELGVGSSPVGKGPSTPFLPVTAAHNPQQHLPAQQPKSEPLAPPPPRPKTNAPKTGKAVAPSETIPEFVDQYYRTSTFHHLSSWRLRFQKMISDLLASKAMARPVIQKENPKLLTAYHHQQLSSETSSGGTSSSSEADNNNLSLNANLIVGRKEIIDAANRESVGATASIMPVIFHVDMDCYYVSVALRSRPQLRGQPVVVCPSGRVAENSTSEVASASYEARALGIKARMLLKDARKLCPSLTVLPCDFEEYEKVSIRMYEIFVKYTNRVQAVSADEAFLDMTVFANPEMMARQMKEEIFAATMCPASIGIAHNILLARLATKRAKPDGIFYLKSSDVESFLDNLPAVDLPGVGAATAKRLSSRGITTVKQIRNCTKEFLMRELGKKHGEMLFEFARGRDQRQLQSFHQRKSVGTQISWGVRFSEMDQVLRFLEDMSKEVQKRMKEVAVKGKRVNIKIKRRMVGAAEPTKLYNPGAHDVINRSTTLAQHTNDPIVIARECLRLFQQTRIPIADVRGLGIQMEMLENEIDPNISSNFNQNSRNNLSSLDRFLQKQPSEAVRLQQEKIEPSLPVTAQEKVQEEKMAEDEEKKKVVVVKKEKQVVVIDVDDIQVVSSTSSSASQPNCSPDLLEHARRLVEEDDDEEAPILLPKKSSSTSNLPSASSSSLKPKPPAASSSTNTAPPKKRGRPPLKKPAADTKKFKQFTLNEMIG